MPSKYRSLVFVLLSLFSGVAARPAEAACSSTCPDSFVRGSRFPYVTMIDNVQITINGNANSALAQWYTIQGPCSTGQLHGSESFNAVSRAQYSLQASTVPIGSKFETRLRVMNGTTQVAASAYTRAIRGTERSASNRRFRAFGCLIRCCVRECGPWGEQRRRKTSGIVKWSRRRT
jgi:hypothetical protein